MTTQRESLSRWRSKLAETETLLATGSQRLVWLRRIYARVYRFLLSTYGDDAPQPARGALGISPPPEPTIQTAVHEDLPVTGGAEPKTASRIRETLNRVHDANEPAASTGPLTHGLDREAWIVVASETAHISPKRCQKLLNNAGIVAKVVRRGDDRLVEVKQEDRAAAFELVERNRSALRTRTKLHRLRLLGAIFGFGVGAVMFALLGIVASSRVVQPSLFSNISLMAVIGGGLGAFAGGTIGISIIRRT